MCRCFFWKSIFSFTLWHVNVSVFAQTENLSLFETACQNLYVVEWNGFLRFPFESSVMKRCCSGWSKYLWVCLISRIQAIPLLSFSSKIRNMLEFFNKLYLNKELREIPQSHNKLKFSKTEEDNKLYHTLIWSLVCLNCSLK